VRNDIHNIVSHPIRHFIQAVFSTLSIFFKKIKILILVILLLEMKKRVFLDSTHTFALILVGTQVLMLGSEREMAC
jgi:hypothetical protein